MKNIFLIVLAVGCLLSPQMAFGATNLLTNGDFSAGTSAGWTVIQNGGSGASFVGAFVTSYEWAAISQTIDLVAAGYTTAELDAAPGLVFNVVHTNGLTMMASTILSTNCLRQMARRCSRANSMVPPLRHSI